MDTSSSSEVASVELEKFSEDFGCGGDGTEYVKGINNQPIYYCLT